MATRSRAWSFEEGLKRVGDPRASVPESEVQTAQALAGRADAVDVRIYVITGRHGIVTVPESFCRECDLFIRAVDKGAEQADAEARVRVLSWWGRALGALWYGGYHPPVLVVDGRRICQGYQVPTSEEVARAIDAAARSR